MHVPANSKGASGKYKVYVRVISSTINPPNHSKGVLSTPGHGAGHSYLLCSNLCPSSSKYAVRSQSTGVSSKQPVRNVIESSQGSVASDSGDRRLQHLPALMSSAAASVVAETAAR